MQQPVDRCGGCNFEGGKSEWEAHVRAATHEDEEKQFVWLEQQETNLKVWDLAGAGRSLVFEVLLCCAVLC